MKQLTINPATILCQRVIHDEITADGISARELADTLADSAKYYGGELQTIQIRLTLPVWHGTETGDEHNTDIKEYFDQTETTYAMAILHLVRELFGVNVAADLSPYLLDPSMITDDWS